MMAAMVELFCDSFAEVPTRIVLDIDDTEDRVHGRQQLALFHAHYGGYCFLPIHVYEAISGKPVAVILRPGKTPGGAGGRARAAPRDPPHPRPLAQGRHPGPRGQPLRPAARTGSRPRPKAALSGRPRGSKRMSGMAKVNAPPAPRVRALESAADVKREAGKLYRAARRGEVLPGDASRLASVLALILKVVEGADLEARVGALERAQDRPRRAA